MKNDIKKIDKVTFEMKMNDIVYEFVQTVYAEYKMACGKIKF